VEFAVERHSERSEESCQLPLNKKGGVDRALTPFLLAKYSV